MKNEKMMMESRLVFLDMEVMGSTWKMNGGELGYGILLKGPGIEMNITVYYEDRDEMSLVSFLLYVHGIFPDLLWDFPDLFLSLTFMTWWGLIILRLAVVGKLNLILRSSCQSSFRSSKLKLLFDITIHKGFKRNMSRWMMGLLPSLYGKFYAI